MPPNLYSDFAGTPLFNNAPLFSLPSLSFLSHSHVHDSHAQQRMAGHPRTVHDVALGADGRYASTNRGDRTARHRFTARHTSFTNDLLLNQLLHVVACLVPLLHWVAEHVYKGSVAACRPLWLLIFTPSAHLIFLPQHSLQRWAASCGAEGVARVWDLQSSRCEATFTSTEPLYAVATNSGGNWLVRPEND